MRDVFWNLGALMAAAWFAQKKKQKPPEQKDQVLKSRRMEDEIYRQHRQQSETLENIRQSCESRLPVVENLSRDVFQSFYTLDVRHNEQGGLSPLVRRFNRHILGEIMKSPDYPAMKSICEGAVTPPWRPPPSLWSGFPAALTSCLPPPMGITGRWTPCRRRNNGRPDSWSSFSGRRRNTNKPPRRKPKRSCFRPPTACTARSGRWSASIRW